MTIIKIAKQAESFHLIETQSHRTHNWLGGEYAIVPTELENQAIQSQGYCDIATEEQFENQISGYDKNENPTYAKVSIGQVVTSIVLTEKPLEPEPEPTTDEILSIMLRGE